MLQCHFSMMESARNGLSVVSNISSKFIIHLESGFAGSSKLWPLFRFADWLHHSGWLRALPRDPWCCHGERQGTSLRDAATSLGAFGGPEREQIRLRVHMEETIACDDRLASGGYRHVPTWSGIMYDANLSVSPELVRERKRRTPSSWEYKEVEDGEEDGRELSRWSAPALEDELGRCAWVYQQISAPRQPPDQPEPQTSTSMPAPCDPEAETCEVREGDEAVSARGNPECWITGYTYEMCCDLALGPQGNGNCWDSVFTYDSCCFFRG